MITASHVAEPASAVLSFIMFFILAGGALTAYATCSGLLLHYPSLLHEKKPSLFPCAHISHRGGAAERPENTLSAFSHAVEDCGTDLLELDCQLTADGHVVVAHDEHLGRCGRPDQLVSDTLYADLPPLSAALPLDFVADGSYDASHAADRRLPLLSEVFARFPATPINVDVKTGSVELVEAVDQLVRGHRRQLLTVWGSSDDAAAARCRRQNPDTPQFFSLRSVLWVVLAAYTGLLPFVPLRRQFFEVPMPAALGRSAVGLRVHWTGWLMDLLLMRPFLLRHLRRRGIEVFVWVLNEEKDYRRAYELGASAVMTDYPSKLRTFLDNNPQYECDKSAAKND